MSVLSPRRQLGQTEACKVAAEGLPEVGSLVVCPRTHLDRLFVFVGGWSSGHNPQGVEVPIFGGSFLGQVVKRGFALPYLGFGEGEI